MILADIEHLDGLGEVVWYSKFELAEIQLERAISLFINEKDYVSAIALAGAAEEIFGNLLKKMSQQRILNGQSAVLTSLGEYMQNCKYFVGEEFDKWLKYDYNFTKNNLKHLNVNPPKVGPDGDKLPAAHIAIFSQQATSMIDRALRNRFELSNKSKEFSSYMNEEILNKYYEVCYQ